MAKDSAKTKKFVENIGRMAQRDTAATDSRSGDRSARAEGATRALQEERRLSREKLERAASV